MCNCVSVHACWVHMVHASARVSGRKCGADTGAVTFPVLYQFNQTYLLVNRPLGFQSFFHLQYPCLVCRGDIPLGIVPTPFVPPLISALASSLH